MIVVGVIVNNWSADQRDLAKIMVLLLLSMNNVLTKMKDKMPVGLSDSRDESGRSVDLALMISGMVRMTLSEAARN